MKKYRCCLLLLVVFVGLFATGCASTGLPQAQSVALQTSAFNTEKNLRVQATDRDMLISLIDQDLTEWDRKQSEVKSRLEKTNSDLKWSKGLTWIGGGGGGLISAGASAAGSVTTGGVGGAIVIIALGTKGVFFQSDDLYGKTIESCNKYLQVHDSEVPTFRAKRFEVTSDVTPDSIRTLQATYLSVWSSLRNALVGCLY